MKYPLIDRKDILYRKKKYADEIFFQKYLQVIILLPIFVARFQYG
jgi:hypothetical protein